MGAQRFRDRFWPPFSAQLQPVMPQVQRVSHVQTGVQLQLQF